MPLAGALPDAGAPHPANRPAAISVLSANAANRFAFFMFNSPFSIFYHKDRSLFLNGTDHDALDKIFLQEGIQTQNWQHGDDDCRHLHGLDKYLITR